MIIYTGLTLIVGVWFLLLFPDSPVKARFLTKEEKVCTRSRESLGFLVT
jgi:hypothetical protein